MKIAINGLGRIGRHVFKILTDKHPKAEIVAINDLADVKTITHLLRFDSIYGRWKKKLKRGKELIVKQKKALGSRFFERSANLRGKTGGCGLECTALYRYDVRPRLMPAPKKDHFGAVKERKVVYVLESADQYDRKI